jgi:sialic acid synthase SpsE
MKNKIFFKKEKFFLIAEAGNNHEGSIKKAKKLISEAAKAGADAIKFQAVDVEKFYRKNSNKDRFDQLRKFQLNRKQYLQLSKFAKKNKIVFFATPFDLDIAKYLNKIQPIFKIASGDNNFFDLIKKVLAFGKPLIVSTGLLNFGQITKLNKFLIKNKKNNEIVLMHCVSIYPTPLKYINLESILFLKERFKKIIVGYSDHSKGIKACIYAAVLGARVIEKHFTLDKNQSSFRDHKISANPKELKILVNSLHEVVKIRGYFEKKPSKEEMKNAYLMRRSAVANKNLIKNHKLKENDISFLRDPKKKKKYGFTTFIGKKLKKSVNKNKDIIF